MCGCGCDCVGVIVWMCVGVIAWARKAVCGCDCVDMCEGVVVIVWVRRGRGSLDGWCMLVWCGRGVNYVGWNGTMWMRHL